MSASVPRSPGTAAQSAADPQLRGLTATFLRHDGPTLLVAIFLYAAWTALVLFHAHLSWWLITPIGAYLVAWHFSLQHEAIHSLRGIPAWLRFALVFPPLGLWFPFTLYRKSHSIHHRDQQLTDPQRDTESYYVYSQDWQALNPFWRAVLMANQTLLGRLVLGPVLRLSRLAQRETGRVRRGDYSHLPAWLIHAVAVGILFWFISHICGMRWWQYVLGIAYPGMSLGLLRAFTEHRWAPRITERTASVESNLVFGLLFLFNNLHIVHHLEPALPWYRIPGAYRRNRDRLLELNGYFVYRGYGEIAVTFLFRPVFVPVLPDASDTQVSP
jgi:fatty acid desaturase